MKLAWCVLALVLAGSDNLAPAQSPPVSSAWCVNSEAVEVWPLRVREALRMGLENNTSVHVTFAGDRNAIFWPNCFGGPTEVEDKEKRPRPKFANRTSIVVESPDAESSIARIKSEVMTTVRSVEQLYWSLAAAHAGLWAADRAVQFAEHVVEIEETDEDLGLGVRSRPARRCHAAPQAIPEVSPELPMSSRPSGSYDNSWAHPNPTNGGSFPLTHQLRAPLVFAWGTRLESVLTKRPDVLQWTDLCHRHRENLVEALRALDEALPPRETPIEDELSLLLSILTPTSASPEPSRGMCCERPYNVLEAWVKYRRESHESPHAFAQAMLEADRTYQCYAIANRLRNAGGERLEAQRLIWGKGRATTDRYLDAVGQYAALVTNERRHLAAYNSAIALVNESEGILLENHNIFVAAPTGQNNSQQLTGRVADQPAQNASLAASASPPARAKAGEEKEIWALTLHKAIEIGMDNSEIIRVIHQGPAAIPVGNCFGPPSAEVLPPRIVPADLPKGMKSDCSSLVISRLNADASIHRFKSEAMAHIRSVEQHYWKLAEASAAVWAAEQAVDVAKDVVKCEETDIVGSHGSILGVVEATQRLEQFQKVLTDRKSDADKAERLLRKLLGLPESDNRQIIPVDQPLKEHVVFDWDTCHEEMMQMQPDIVQQQAITHLADQKVIERVRAIDDASPKSDMNRDAGVNLASTRVLPPLESPSDQIRRAKDALRRSQAFMDQVTHQTTASLARAVLEADSGYKHYAQAKRLRTAAHRRLDAQRAYWEEGRITADRYFDAVEQYATLVANEHQSLAAYNSALAFVSECKGTLLDDHNIIVADSPPVAGTSPASPSR